MRLYSYFLAVACLTLSVLGAKASEGESAEARSRLDITNAVRRILKPVVEDLGSYMVEVERDRSSVEKRKLLDAKAANFMVVAEKNLGPAARAGNPHAQYYYGRAAYLASGFLTRIGGRTTTLDETARTWFEKSAAQKHPGAAEMLATFAKGEAEEKAWRLKAMQWGCITSFRRARGILGSFDTETAHTYLPSLEEVYTLAVLQILVEARWLGRLDPRDEILMGIGHHVRLDLRDKHREKFLVEIAKCEGRALEMFNRMGTDYLISELELETW